SMAPRGCTAMVAAAPPSTRSASASANSRSSSSLRSVRKYCANLARREAAGCSPARPGSVEEVNSTRSVGKPSLTSLVRTRSASRYWPNTASNTALMCISLPSLPSEWARKPQKILRPVKFMGHTRVSPCCCSAAMGRVIAHRLRARRRRSRDRRRCGSLLGDGVALAGRRRRTGLLLRARRLSRRLRRLLQELFERHEDAVVLVVGDLELPARDARRKLLGLGGGLLGSGARRDRDQGVRTVLAAGEHELEPVEGAKRRTGGRRIRRASALAHVFQRQRAEGGRDRLGGRGARELAPLGQGA